MTSAAADGDDVGEQPELRYDFPPPPVGGWTADDLDRMPGLPPHTELLDGGLFFRSPQTYFHMATLRLLGGLLLAQAPSDVEIIREMSTKLGKRDRPEPDLWRYV
ncbi:hypothetical protein GCM10014713_30820 [Streptomyces purpureus]|uniref:Uma2 family endonuclease n=1 Tax=Streptomyces purpureus TaxID=1951 RepID=A0A918LQA7_9ACTN|nr:hypothetical protein GCM10014713_30820 [Streptomyces purpureus]